MIVLWLVAKEILLSPPRNTPVVDGMHGTKVIAGQTTGTPSVVNPRGRCSFDIIHGADLRTLAALDTHIFIHGEFPVRYHPLVEITADDIGVESGSGTFLQLFDTAPPFLDHLDDMGPRMSFSWCCVLRALWTQLASETRRSQHDLLPSL